MEIINGKNIASELEGEIYKETNNMRKLGIIPTLSLIVIKGDKKSELYVKRKKEACERVGIKGIIKKINNKISTKEFILKIEEMNNDKRINGILFQTPLPSQLNEIELSSVISPEKDVDGLNPGSVGRTLLGERSYVSAGAIAAKTVIEKNGIKIKDANCVILGTNNILCKPFAALMIKEEGNVIILSEESSRINELTPLADIVLIDIEKPKFLKSNMIKKGCLIIDCGYNEINGKLIGNVDKESVKDKAKFLTPVPGGIGPILIAALMKQVVGATQNQNNLTNK
tara:strand:- start:257 stop:1111 length:855 start_codon:yes stop_codon:yes gene_type:complete